MQTTNFLDKKIIVLRKAISVDMQRIVLHSSYTVTLLKESKVVNYTCLFSGRYWEMVERLKVNHFYTTPSAIKKLMKDTPQCMKSYDLSSLKTIACGKVSSYYALTSAHSIITESP